MDENDQPRRSDAGPYFLFVGAAGPALQPGEEVPHGRVRDYFSRSKQAVQQEWRSVIGDLQDVLADVAELREGFTLEEIEVQLGFTAEGQLAFVTKAGVEATITMTFKRELPESGTAGAPEVGGVRAG